MTRPAGDAPWPTAATRPVALLGWPVGHSLSPVIHNAAFREQGIDLVYLALPTPPEALGTVVHALGAVGAAGANVTVPHKQAVVDHCDGLTEEASLIGAVNTLVWGADGLIGDNTDAAGLADALEADVHLPQGEPVVLLGTGGAARAAAVAVGRLGTAVTVVGRRGRAAAEVAELAGRAGAAAARGLELNDSGSVAAALAAARLVVNATPLGLDGEELPPPFHQLGPGQIAYDLIYPSAASDGDLDDTPFLRDARARGAAAHHGLGMLVGQAAASYRSWTGREAPTATMSAAALGALAAPRRG